MKCIVIDDPTKKVRVVEVTVHTRSFEEADAELYCKWQEPQVTDYEQWYKDLPSKYEYWTYEVQCEELFTTTAREALVMCMTRMDRDEYSAKNVRIVSADSFDKYMELQQFKLKTFESFQSYKESQVKEDEIEF